MERSVVMKHVEEAHMIFHMLTANKMRSKSNAHENRSNVHKTKNTIQNQYYLIISSVEIVG